ncbi:IncP plasmid survival protein KfrC family protein [Variovorax sp. CAN15]|uniref:IncP plasmid survival protein KfrC family protein n=1 Tax=Variovorax sp. CAN15 TaxID=3046727 RepID=UPI002648CEEA|nr:IncP plasmid survival protein KfrC family protein [Variovorax sp. CAN15]
MRASEAEDANEVDIATSYIEVEYLSSFATRLQATSLQVQRLEDRLEVLIEDQTKRLQRVEQQRPGILSLPSTRSKWQAETQANLALLRRMHGRLERVREVRDGMLPSGPLIEHLAKQKLRAQDPELVDSWEQARQARRVHEQHLLLQDRAKKRVANAQGAESGRVHSISLQRST